MRRLTIIAACLLVSAPALAQSDAQLAESQRYLDCLDQVAIAPEEALEDALSWRNDGGGWPARHCHARSLAALGESEAAALHLENIASEPRPGMLTHERLGIWMEAGALWMQIEAYEAAILAYSSALALDAMNSGALAGRALAYSGLGEWEDAAADAQRLTAGNADHATGWRLLAEAQLEMGDLDAASAAIIRALQQEPANIDTLVLRGRINEARRLAGG